MAYSTTDIPAALLANPDRATFVNWLASIPTTASVKRRLFAVYSRATGVQFTAADYTAALSPPRPS